MTLRRLAWLWAPPVALMAVIFVSSSQATLTAPAAVSDKVMHFVVFGLLGLTFARALASARWRGVTGRAVLLAITLTTVYGMLDEWHQSFVPPRTAEWADVLADAVGATVAVGALWTCGIIGRARNWLA